MEENVIIVDRDNRPLGIRPRSVMRRDNLIHRAAYILVFNPENELFVQKRTRTKDVYPGYFDLAAGGVVLENESYEQAATRELHEELGIRQSPLAYLFDNYYEDHQCKVWGRVYQCCYNGPMHLQAEEIESGFFLKPDAILNKLSPDRITPDSVQIIRRYLDR